MCSITQAVPTPITVAGFGSLVAHAREVTEAVRATLAADPSLLATMPAESLEGLTLDLHAAVDAASAVATVATGQVEQTLGRARGVLIAGRYVSTQRWLEVEAGASPAQARVTVARGRDLVTHSTAVADAWLAGAITGGAVRPLTVGVTDVLRRSGLSDSPTRRAATLDVLLPLATSGGVGRLAEQVQRIKHHVDPDGCTEDALHASDHQSLSILGADGMFRIAGWLTPETAAATLTVLDRRARIIGEQAMPPVIHDGDCDALVDAAHGCTCGELDRALRAAGLRRDQLLARALGETMTDLLDNAEIGSHHRVAPHLTVVTDLTDLTAPLIGELDLPGSDHPTLLPAATLHRLLCDAEVTRVVTRLVTPGLSCGSGTLAPELVAPDLVAADLVAQLEQRARAVLYVGRAERTVSPRLRRALEARDGHCVFPGCRARPRRCHAHHVLPWEEGGETDLPNTALLCVAHHHAMHEGGWAMALKPGSTGHEQDCWDFSPPTLSRQPRP